MVAIPTARDVGRVSTRSGRIATSGPSVSVGEGIAQMGQGLQQVAYDLNTLRQQEDTDNQNKIGFDLETKIARFRDAEEQAFNAARDGASESGVGFTRQFIEGYQERANAFGEANFSGLNDAQKERAKQSILGLGNSLYGKAHGYEQVAKTAFYDRTTNTGLDSVRLQIKNNAAPFEDLKRQGLAAIDAADMPEPWKAERRALWESDAAESKWQWKFAQDPQTAIRDIKGQSGSIVDKIIGVESGGNATAKNPNSSATGAGQFVAGTWTNMIKRYRPELADGRSAQEVLALRNDPQLSREMTQRYAEENAEFLRNQGIQTTDGNVYLAHFLGPRGAAQVLKADPGASVASIVGQGVVSANGFLAGKSAADLRAWADKKMGGTSTQYDAIPYDRREQLANWGETQYNQQLVQKRTETKDGYNLLIATQPDQVDERVILQDVNLDNGDKAALINSLNTARKENAGVSAFIGALSSGGASVNPFDSDQTKIADKAFEKMLGAATTAEQQQVVMSGFVASTGYVPKKVQADLRRGAASSNPSEVAQAMQAASVLQKNAPISFNGFEGGDAVRKNLDLYRAYTDGMGLSPEEAGRKIVDLSDPEKVRQRDAVLKSKPVADALKAVRASDVAAIFDRGLFSAAPDVGGVATSEQVRVGVNTEAEAVIVADYRSILEESIADTNGDIEAAKELAKQRFSRSYGTSDLSPLGPAVVAKYPPEKAYPAMQDGTHDYIRDQVVTSLKAEGVNSSAVYLQADDLTEQDIRAGRAPRYQVFYEQDGKLERYFLPFFADPEAAKSDFRQKQDEAVKEAERQMQVNREEELRRFPEGRGRAERFNSGNLYRGIAREGSPMGEALKRAQDDSEQVQKRAKAYRDDEAKRRAEFDALSPEERRARSMDEFLTGPIKAGGNR